jgi:non-ribosomal peptide synthetase component F
MILLAAFKVLLLRYSGQTDVLVGTLIANRNHPGLEELIGFFVNTLVLRTDLSGNPSFRETLTRLRPVALDAYEHQDLPFETLVGAPGPRRSLSHTPVFQVAFAPQNTPAELPQIPHLTMQPLNVDVGTAKFDLTLSMMETEREEVPASAAPATWPCPIAWCLSAPSTIARISSSAPRSNA